MFKSLMKWFGSSDLMMLVSMYVLISLLFFCDEMFDVVMIHCWSVGAVGGIGARAKFLFPVNPWPNDPETQPYSIHGSLHRRIEQWPQKKTLVPWTSLVGFGSSWSSWSIIPWKTGLVRDSQFLELHIIPQLIINQSIDSQSKPFLNISIFFCHILSQYNPPM